MTSDQLFAWVTFAGLLLIAFLVGRLYESGMMTRAEKSGRCPLCGRRGCPRFRQILDVPSCLEDDR